MYTLFKQRYENVGLSLGKDFDTAVDWTEAEAKALAEAKRMGSRNPRIIEGAISVPGEVYIEIVEGRVETSAAA